MLKNHIKRVKNDYLILLVKCLLKECTERGKVANSRGIGGIDGAWGQRHSSVRGLKGYLPRDTG